MEVTRPTSHSYLEILIDHIVPNPRNVNHVNEKEVQNIAANIKEHGFFGSIQVIPMSDEKYFIFDGEHRWRAAKIAGQQYINCELLTSEKWADEDLLDLVAFRMNILRGKVDQQKFIPFYDRVAKRYGPDSVKDILYISDDKLWTKLTGGIKSSMKKAGIPEAALKEMEAASAKTKDFNQFAKVLNKIFSSQAIGANTKCIVFVSQQRENIIIQATDNLFALIKALDGVAAQKSKSLSELLEPAIVRLVAETGETNNESIVR